MTSKTTKARVRITAIEAHLDQQRSMLAELEREMGSVGIILYTEWELHQILDNIGTLESNINLLSGELRDARRDLFAATPKRQRFNLPGFQRLSLAKPALVA